MKPIIRTVRKCKPLKYSWRILREGRIPSWEKWNYIPVEQRNYNYWRTMNPERVAQIVGPLLALGFSMIKLSITASPPSADKLPWGMVVWERTHGRLQLNVDLNPNRNYPLNWGSMNDGLMKKMFIDSHRWPTGDTWCFFIEPPSPPHYRMTRPPIGVWIKPEGQFCGEGDQFYQWHSMGVSKMLNKFCPQAERDLQEIF